MENIREFEYTERVNFENPQGVMENKEIKHKISVDQKAPKLGVMLVGLGGNNGSTFTAGIMANRQKLSWTSKNGVQTANYYGSFTQTVTTLVGYRKTEAGAVEDVHKTIKDIVPLADLNALEITGWDISSMNIYDSCYRAQVLEPTLIEQLKPELSSMVPLKAVFNPKYVASNQSDRCDNIFEGTNLECVEKLRKDIQEFKTKVDKVVILWTANTEQFFEKDIMTAAELTGYIENDEVLPASVLYGYAAALESCVFLNGSPQNTVSEGMIELNKIHNTYIGGSDFKTGQTKFKSIMADFFIGTGLKLAS